MANVENDLICNITQLKMQTLKDKKTNFQQLRKNRNSAGCNLISASTSIVDTKNQFSNIYLFWEKN